MFWERESRGRREGEQSLSWGRGAEGLTRGPAWLGRLGPGWCFLWPVDHCFPVSYIPGPVVALYGPSGPSEFSLLADRWNRGCSCSGFPDKKVGEKEPVFKLTARTGGSGLGFGN